MRFGIDIAQQRQEFDEILGRPRFVEELGFEGAWGFDHFVAMYGDGPGNCFEGMTTLAALASATTTIRLGLLVTGVTYRHPSVLAAEALTVDHASHGRLELAIGSAWFDAEHRQLGIDFPTTGRRFDRLEDALEIFTRLFTGEVVSYEGREISLDNARLRPIPVQQPHPPIWIGGAGPRRTLPLVARFADVWHTYGSPDRLRELSVTVDRMAEEAGRRPGRHPPGLVTVALRTLGRSDRQRHGHGRGRDRLSRLRLAGRGTRPGRGVRHPGHARAPHRLNKAAD